MSADAGATRPGHAGGHGRREGRRSSRWLLPKSAIGPHRYEYQARDHEVVAYNPEWSKQSGEEGQPINHVLAPFDLQMLTSILAQVVGKTIRTSTNVQRTLIFVQD